MGDPRRLPQSLWFPEERKRNGVGEPARILQSGVGYHESLLPRFEDSANAKTFRFDVPATEVLDVVCEGRGRPEAAAGSCRPAAYL